MLLMLLIGWTILLPVVVVCGLYLTSNVLGRRRRMALASMPDPVRQLALRVAGQTEAASAAQSVPAASAVVRATEPVARPTEPVADQAVGATY